MSSSNFDLSNPYLKFGGGLVMVALTAIAVTSFFSTDRELQAVVRNISGLSIFAGSIIYVIGRVVRAIRSRAQA